MGRAATTFYRRLASLLSKKQGTSYSKTMDWVRCHLNFALLRASIMSINLTMVNYGVLNFGAMEAIKTLHIQHEQENLENERERELEQRWHREKLSSHKRHKCTLLSCCQSDLLVLTFSICNHSMELFEGILLSPFSLMHSAVQYVSSSSTFTAPVS